MVDVMSNTTNTAPEARPSLDAATSAVDAYLATWNETDSTARAERSSASLGDDIWYRDPMLESDGLEAYGEMIAAVQAQFPGFEMRRTSDVDLHHDVVRFEWALGLPGEDPAIAGLDVAKLDDGGKLHRIIGFVPARTPGAVAE